MVCLLKKIIRILFVFILAISVMLLLQAFILPGIVQKILLTQLSEIGLTEAALEVNSCSFKKAELVNIQIDEEGCAIVTALRAQFSPLSLLNGKLKNVTVTGGQLLIGIHDGRIELGPLAQIKSSKSSGQTNPVFESIELCACTLLVEWDEKLITIPCRGTIAYNDMGELKSDLSLTLHSNPFGLHITANSRSGMTKVLLDGKDIDVGVLASVLPRTFQPDLTGLTGKTDFQLQAEYNRKDQSIVSKLMLSKCKFAAKLFGESLVCEEAKVKFESSFDMNLKLKNIKGQLIFDKMEIYGIPVQKVQVGIDTNGHQIIAKCNAEGKGWKLTDALAEIPLYTANKDLAKESFRLSWGIKGRFPEEILVLLSKNGIDASLLGPLNIRGQVETPLSKLPFAKFIELHVDLQPGDISIIKSGTVFHELSGKLHLKGSFDRTTAKFLLMPESGFGAQNITINEAELTGTKFQINPRHLQKLEIEQDNGKWKYLIDTAMIAESTAILSKENSITAQIDNLHLHAETTFSSLNWKSQSFLKMDKIACSMTSPESEVNLSDVILQADTEQTGENNPILKGTLLIGKAEIIDDEDNKLVYADDSTIRPVHYNYDFHEHKGGLRSAWIMPNDEQLNITGKFEQINGKPSVRLIFACDELTLNNKEHPIFAKIQEVTGFQFTGRYSINSVFSWQGSKSFVPRIEITALDGQVVNEDIGLQAIGISGKVVFVGLDPLLTHGNQRFDIQSLMVGKLDLKNGHLTFRCEKEPEALFIEETEWDCLGGKILSGGFRIDSTDKDKSFKIFIQDIKLNRLLNVVSSQNPSATGSLTGVVPVIFSPSNEHQITLGQGFLYATSGNGQWKFQQNSTNSPIGKILAQQLKRIANASKELDQKQLLNGLLDFDYGNLRVDLIEDTTGLTARITTKGKSRNPRVPVEFEEIMLVIPRINNIINEVIKAKSVLEPGLNNLMGPIQP